jgi:hypothetical protein
MTGYPGSKGASGLAQRIIRQMPPHEIYIEPFAGFAAVFRKKRLAASSILMDVDVKVCAHLRSYLAVVGGADRTHVVHGDAMDLLPLLPAVQASTTLLYLDPPYLIDVRTRLLYDFEFSTPEAHSALLAMIKPLPCMVMISGYWSELYADALSDWRFFKVPAMTRGGLRIEHVWCNFDEPGILHDPRWAGKDFRDRERIKRKRERWTRRFFGMHPRERQAIAAALLDVDRAAVDAAMRTAPPEPAMAAATAGPGDAADGEARTRFER